MSNTQKTVRAGDNETDAFTEEERAAMKARAQELKTAGRRKSGADKADGERDVLAKFAEMPEQDRAMGERIHELVTAAAPDLVPRTFYGMPAYAKDGSVLCYFKPGSKFKMRYATFGFTDKAHLDDGAMWPTDFALTELTPADEARITELVKKAVG